MILNTVGVGDGREVGVAEGAVGARDGLQCGAYVGKGLGASKVGVLDGVAQSLSLFFYKGNFESNRKFLMFFILGNQTYCWTSN